MEENTQNKQGKNGGKGLIIIIIVVVLAAAAYFIIQAVNKKGGQDGQTAQSNAVISESDQLELNDLNLFGKWNKKVGDVRYELNFKSDKELVYTQYDKDGNVTAQSESGTYSTENGVVNMTIVSQGQTFAETCNAVVSVEKLVITTVQGSGLFTGTYDADMSDVPNFDNESGTAQSELVSPTVSQNVSQPETVSQENPVSQENTVDKSNYESIPSEIYAYLHLNPYVLRSMSSTKPERDMIGELLTINSEKVYIEVIDNGYYDPFVASMTVPIKWLFRNNGSYGNDSYTYSELKEMLGDRISYSYREDDMVYSGGYTIQALFNNNMCNVTFGDINAGAIPLDSLDTPITYCCISRLDLV